MTESVRKDGISTIEVVDVKAAKVPTEGSCGYVFGYEILGVGSRKVYASIPLIDRSIVFLPLLLRPQNCHLNIDPCEFIIKWSDMTYWDILPNVDSDTRLVSQ